MEDGKGVCTGLTMSTASPISCSRFARLLPTVPEICGLGMPTDLSNLTNYGLKAAAGMRRAPRITDIQINGVSAADRMRKRDGKTSLELSDGETGISVGYSDLAYSDPLYGQLQYRL